MKEYLTIIISIYAAVISTFVFIWRIFEYYSDRIGKISIAIRQTEVGDPIKIDDISETVKVLPDDILNYNWTKIIEIKIINVGRVKREFELPNLLMKQNDEMVRYFNSSTVDQYAKSLEPGEKFTTEIPLKYLQEYFKNGNFELIYKLEDSYGKIYKSNRLTLTSQ